MELVGALRAALPGDEVEVVDADSRIPHNGLVIAVGMRASVAAANSDAPVVLNLLIPKSGYEELLHNFPKRSGTDGFSAIFLDQPFARQLALISAELPEARRIGVLYDGYSRTRLLELRQAATESGYTLYEQHISDAAPLREGVHQVTRGSEVLLALPDALVYNSSTIRDILLESYRARIPLIGFSPAYVKAGALCAVFTTQEQFANQAAMVIRQFFQTGSLPPATYPRQFEVAVNRQVANSLSLKVKDPDSLREEIKHAVESDR
ncbi:MAG: hypothetical protein GC139_01240 [Sideroxydans sp.]|nr:hypothetical protein [Sideroxydans sp.]